MLGPLKLDFRPEAYAEPLSEQDAAMFRTCGITAFHNSVGVGGPNAYDEAQRSAPIRPSAQRPSSIAWYGCIEAMTPNSANRR